MIGHTKAAAGAAGLIKAALALEHKVLPPTLKVGEPSPALGSGASPFHLPETARPWPAPEGSKRRAAVSSFGFGGSNFHVILEEYRPTRATPSWDGAVELLAASAGDLETLVARIRAQATSLREGEPEAVPATLATGRAAFDAADAHRAVVVLSMSEPSELLEAVEAAAVVIERRGGQGAFQLPTGVSYGCGPVQGGTAFLFPGQGSQYVGMLGELACVFPAVSAALDEDTEVAGWIHPPPAAGADADVFSEALRATERAQPALGAVERGALALLRSFGVEPDAAAGHSYGELVALHAAGALDASALALASRARGEALAAAADEGGDDRGTMLAVLAPVAEVEALLIDEQLELVLANRNGPKQSVLSGSTAAIEAAEAACARRGLRAVRPDVGAAFHSPLVAQAGRRFATALEGISVGVPRIPVIANTTAEAYPSSRAGVRGLLARQPVEPVRWLQSIERLYALGIRTFVEVGPKTTLTSLVGRILGERPHLAVALDRSSGRGSGLQDFAMLLGELATAGIPIRLDRWQLRESRRGAAPPRRRRMSVPLTGANHRDPQAPKPPRAPAITGRVLGPAGEGSSTLSAAPLSTPPPNVSTTPTRPEVSMSAPRPPVPADLLQQALAANEEHLRALQRMQEQTAALHRTFLDGQLAAQAGFQSLLEGRRRIVEQALGLPVSAAPAFVAPSPPAPVLAPAPVVAPSAVPVVAAPTAAAPIAAAPIAAAPIAAAPRVNAPVPTPAPTVDVVAELLAVVAEATGYPDDMLDLDMDLESDLGIDSIKRVEILSLLSERLPNAPVVEPENLGGLRTLRAVAEFVGGAAATTPAIPAPVIAPAAGGSVDAHAALLAVVAESTGYPEDMLDLDMDLEADLGIDSIKRVEILSLLSERLPAAPVVEPEQLGGLRTLREVLDFVSGGRPATDTAPIETSVRSVSPPPAAAVETPWRTAARPEVRRVIATTAPDPQGRLAPERVVRILDDGSPLASALVEALCAEGHSARAVLAAEAADPASYEGADGLILLDSGLAEAFAALRAAAPALRAADEGFLASVVCLDGTFGLSDGSLAGPSSAGLSGLVKTAAREWPDVACFAIDVGPVGPDSATRVLAELGCSGPVERGVTAARRVFLATELDTTPQDAWSPVSGRLSSRLADGCVVVSGGARGVTADCAAALADAGVGGLLLLGRSPAPGPEEAWLAGANTDAEIKRALLTHGSFGARPDLGRVGRAAARVTADREIRSTLRRIEALGARVLYRSVDVRDAPAVATAVEDARREFGRIRGIVHGAGVLRDKLIVDKSDADFALVVGTKVAALEALLAAVSDDELRLLALFSSVSGRFGRKGQSDYAAANQALDGIALREAMSRTDCRVVSFAWGPWDGGMVTPALKREFEREGVSLLNRGAGARLFAEEASAEPGSRPVLLVVGSGLDEGGAVSAEPRRLIAPVETAFDLDLETHPYLDHHRLDGRPVLPLAMAMELLAAAAVRAIGGVFRGLDDVRVLRGVSLSGDAVSLLTHVGLTRADGERDLRAPVELRGADGTVHVRAVARLASPRSPVPSVTPLAPPDEMVDWDGDPADVYARDLFHGPAFQCIRAIDGSSPEGMVVHLAPTPPVVDWLPQAAATEWTTAPLPVDGVFQALILWCRRHHGGPSLPSRVAAYHQLAPFPDGDVRAVIRIRRSARRSVLSDVDLVAEDGSVVARLEGFACTVSAKLDQAFGHGSSTGAPSANA
jgi:acyl transferase domain-containing protein